MWRRRERSTTSAAPAARRVVGGLAVAGLVGTLSLAGANPANAAPKADYTPGKDQVTFTTLGVRDANCLVSVGGNEVFIKPGDKIDFDSDAAGLTLAGLNLSLGKLAGYNVTATIGTGDKKQTVKVAGGKVTTFPNASQTALSKGDYLLTWKVESVALLGLLGQSIDLPLSNANLKSGAALSWRGVLHVTPDAPKCKLGVSTPRVDVSLGPIKVTVPQQNVNVPGVTLPNDVPSLGSLAPKAPTPSKPTSSAPTSTAPSGYQLDGPSVPEQVVPGGSAGEVYSGSGGTILASGNGGFAGILPKLGNSLGAKKASNSAGGTTTDADNVAATSGDKTVELAADAGKPSSQLPVILAILAIIALALVAGTYARLFLLKQKS